MWSLWPRLGSPCKEPYETGLSRRALVSDALSSRPCLHGVQWETEQSVRCEELRRSPVRLEGVFASEHAETDRSSLRTQKTTQHTHQTTPLLVHCTMSCADTHEHKHATARSVSWVRLFFHSFTGAQRGSARARHVHGDCARCVATVSEF